MHEKGIKMYKMKDKTESFHKDKGLMFNLPMRIACVGRSMLSGKTSRIISLLYQSDSRLYKDEFKPENIFIFSPSAHTDFKLKTYIEEKGIPEENIFLDFDEEQIDDLYEILKEQYNEDIEEGKKPEHKLFWFDDMSYSGKLGKKKHGIISKLMCNSRHILLSLIITSQKYLGDLPTIVRENLTGCMLFSCTDKQLDGISDDHNIFDNKKTFKSMFRKVTSEPHTTLTISYSNPEKYRYLNNDFLPIGSCGSVLKEFKGDCKC
jgi:hypothetical protein